MQKFDVQHLSLHGYPDIDDSCLVMPSSLLIEGWSENPESGITLMATTLAKLTFSSTFLHHGYREMDILALSYPIDSQ